MATIVFDADGVLWDGIILYGDEVTLRPGIKDVLKELTKRKHRIVCCSKNDPDMLIGALDRYGLIEFFPEVHASFDVPKSELFRGFLGDNPTLFIDDDPFQRAEVKFAHPQVETEFYPDPLDILNHPFVAKAETEEDLRRVSLLREQRARETAEKGYSKDFQLFLHESKLVLSIYDPYRLEQAPRILDLLNRTNELKTTATRYEKFPIMSHVISAALTDRYGDYGLIGAVVVKPSASQDHIYDLAVSCRTQGRGIGSALVTYLCKERGATYDRVISGVVETTEKNWRMQPLFEYLGFTRGTLLWMWDPRSNKMPEYPAWLKICRYPENRPLGEI